ncbi:MAG: hypothetical protein R3F65_26515 [bacterium]
MDHAFAHPGAAALFEDHDLHLTGRLEAALAAWPGALLLVSHDAAFADALCTRRWRIEGERVHMA